MRPTAEEQKRLFDDGFLLMREVLDPTAVARLRHAVDEIANGHEHNGRTYAARNLLRIPAIAELARSKTILDLLTPALGKNALMEPAGAEAEPIIDSHRVRGG